MSLWASICRQGGVEFLCNQSWNDDVFYFYGCDDLALGAPQLPRRWSGDKTNVLLVHRPDTVIAMDVADSLRGVTLAVCGHTHGGQIRLPFIGPIYASSRYGCALSYGQFEREQFGTRMIVSSGISNQSLRWRFNCRREVVLIEFTA